MRTINDTQNTAKITDGISGDEHEIYYRTPTIKEIKAYRAGVATRKGRKIIDNGTETRLKFGELVISGFKKGTLGFDGKAFSSDENDPDFRPEWKSLLVKHCPDIVIAIATTAFDGTGNSDSGIEFATETDTDD